MPMEPGVDVGTNESKFLHNLTIQMFAKNRIETLAAYGINTELQELRVAKSIEQSLMEEFQVPIVVWGLRRNISLRHLLGYKTLICVSISSVRTEEEPIFDVLNDGLVGLHYVPMLFIYKRSQNTPPTRKMLKVFFAWCWQHRFTNVYLTFRYFLLSNSSDKDSGYWRNDLYSYTPFPKLTLRNLTETGYDPVDIMMDLRGYQFRVPVFQDPPNVFQHSKGYLSGALGLLFTAYVHHRRGRLILEPVDNVDRYNYQEDLMLAATRGEIEIGVHPFSSMQMNSSLVAGSFQVGTTNTCVLVPWQREPPPTRLIRISACINGPFFVIVLLVMTVSWQRVTGHWRRGIHLTLVTFFQQSLPDRYFRRLEESYKCIHIALLFGSFVMWVMRTANLSSVFTSQMLGAQIETAEDFLDSPLRLMLTEMEVEMYFTAGRLPSSLKPRLLVVNRTMLVEHLDSLNTSYAYCTTAEHWSVVMLQQRRMFWPRFRVASKLCTTNQLLRFPVQRNSPFERNFYRFAIHSQQFGFWAHWMHRGLREAIAMGLVKELTDDYQPFKSLTLKDFEILIDCATYKYTIRITEYLVIRHSTITSLVVVKWKQEQNSEQPTSGNSGSDNCKCNAEDRSWEKQQDAVTSGHLLKVHCKKKYY
ncbi:uncharacterized protein LOC108108879 [Drosophila eugracilis]|uniref:uncharacterized protein LOC108108879 n=1 Tax=Drosophila eugracilis TaxID=29029 RepID=UPI0007E6763F|nr:uncharacterized protein LOC108108879 [Drosophila eugracilis]